MDCDQGSMDFDLDDLAGGSRRRMVLGVRRFLRNEQVLKFVCCGLFGPLLVGLFLVSIGLQRRTVAGDNLLSTPWHPMKESTLMHRIGRIPQILRCLDSCGPQPEEKVSLLLQPFNVTTDPGYFKFIDDDLSPWKETGISRHTLQEARKTAAFRITIHEGKLYTELYYQCYQTRMMFTIWGLLELLERYPGQVPDVDFFFNCQDRPQIGKEQFAGRAVPPPLFGYASTGKHFDIPFPDWAFWGWPEIEVPPWDEMLDSTAQQLEWELKDPHAQWRGTLRPMPEVTIRTDLLKCNNTQTGAYIYAQDWHAERKNNFVNSKLREQCDYRYKIYVEGYSWSVSRKFIMSCGSVVLAINSDYYDAFSRGLVAGKHHLPISSGPDMCEDIKKAIKWGNSHPSQAKDVAAESRNFVEHDLSMDNIYRYTLKLLQEYSKLQNFEVEVPELGKLVCKSNVICIAKPLEKTMLQQYY